MSKPYSEADFSEQITQDRAWRLREISDLKAAIDKADESLRRVLLRALVTVCYAHWEGYVRFAARKYLEHVALRRNTRANLNFDVFTDICLVCCVPTQLFADSATFVDVVLLKRRNLIAHGEDTFITIDDLDELTNETITLMRTFGDALENHVYVRDYRAA